MPDNLCIVFNSYNMDARGMPDMYTAIGGNTYCMNNIRFGKYFCGLVRSQLQTQQKIFLITTIEIFRDVHI